LIGQVRREFNPRINDRSLNNHTPGILNNGRIYPESLTIHDMNLSKAGLREGHSETLLLRNGVRPALSSTGVARTGEVSPSTPITLAAFFGGMTNRNVAFSATNKT
jgi:hypothetical protein